MIKVKEIKNRYRVVTFDRGRTLKLYNKEKNTGKRQVYKYFTDVEKVKDGCYKVIGLAGASMCKKIEELDNQVSKKVASYEYDSEYYDTTYRKGIFEQFVVIDELAKKGFVNDNREDFTLFLTNIYGVKEKIARITIDGLDPMKDKLSKEVKIYLHLEDFSWVTAECKREVGEILGTIDSIIQPLLLKQSVDIYGILKTIEPVKTDITMNKMTGSLEINKSNYKQEMIKQLEEALKILKEE